jgi:transketolase
MPAMLRGNAPTALIFSRQALTAMQRTAEQVANNFNILKIQHDCQLSQLYFQTG